MSIEEILTTPSDHDLFPTAPAQNGQELHHDKVPTRSNEQLTMLQDQSTSNERKRMKQKQSAEAYLAMATPITTLFDYFVTDLDSLQVDRLSRMTSAAEQTPFIETLIDQLKSVYITNQQILALAQQTKGVGESLAQSVYLSVLPESRHATWNHSPMELQAHPLALTLTIPNQQDFAALFSVIDSCEAAVLANHPFCFYVDDQQRVITGTIVVLNGTDRDRWVQHERDGHVQLRLLQTALAATTTPEGEPADLVHWGTRVDEAAIADAVATLPPNHRAATNDPKFVYLIEAALSCAKEELLTEFMIDGNPTSHKLGIVSLKEYDYFGVWFGVDKESVLHEQLSTVFQKRFSELVDSAVNLVEAYTYTYAWGPRINYMRNLLALHPIETWDTILDSGGFEKELELYEQLVDDTLEFPLYSFGEHMMTLTLTPDENVQYTVLRTFFHQIDDHIKNNPQSSHLIYLRRAIIRRDQLMAQLYSKSQVGQKVMSFYAFCRQTNLLQYCRNRAHAQAHDLKDNGSLPKLERARITAHRERLFSVLGQTDAIEAQLQQLLRESDPSNPALERKRQQLYQEHTKQYESLAEVLKYYKNLD